MFYVMYLTGLCQRRHWPDPLYECFRTRSGRYTCTVRVNNREYTSDAEYETDELARDAAATRAYLICRHFSVNDGMIPGQRQGQGGVVQGLPVAIGTGRRRTAGSHGSSGDTIGSEQGSGSSSGSDGDRSNSSSRAGHRLSDGDSSVTSVDASVSSIGSSGSMNDTRRSKASKSREMIDYGYNEFMGTGSGAGCIDNSPSAVYSGSDGDAIKARRRPNAAKAGLKRAANGKPDMRSVVNMNMNQKQRIGMHMGMGPGMSTAMGMPGVEICYCGQAVAQLYGRCGNCLRQSGW